MALSPFPLPLRDALARLALAAFDSEPAREALGWLASSRNAAPPAEVGRLLARLHLVDLGASELLAIHTPWREAVAHHAHRALHAALAAVPAGRADPLERALAQAEALWAQGLFFEVHEVLEPFWHGSEGAMRDALQGLIQIAAAWHHLAHGNHRGARKLLVDGRARLAEAGDALRTVDATALLAATAPWVDALVEGRPLPAGPLPLLRRRTGG